MLYRLFLVLLPVLAVLALAQPSQAATPSERRAEAKRLQSEGNFREAAVIYRSLVLNSAVPAKDAASDLTMASACFLRLGEPDEVRALLDAVTTARPTSWRVLARAAYPLSLPGRGGYRDRDAERSRVLSLQLMLRAEANLGDPDDPANADDRIGFYQSFIRLLLRDRDGMLAWRLTGLTDLDNPPAEGESAPPYTLPRRHAPVDADGNPVYHRRPDSWEAAKTDGERYRWLLAQLASINEEGEGAADLHFGLFLMEQFGVQTITANSPLVSDADIGGETGPYAVRTLLDAETVARLATGLKRFSPPEEFNHIAVLRSAAESDNVEVRGDALAALATVYENRQQYPRAVSFWQRRADLNRRNRIRDDESTLRLERIAGNNGTLETGPIAPAGQRTTLSYLYRNGKSVALVAKRLDEKKLLDDIRTAIKSGDNELLHSYAGRKPEMLARLVVGEDASQYVAETVAEWNVDLDPLPDHFSRRASLELPFDTAGCYLIEARMQNGNTSRLVIWIHDLVVVRKNTGDRQLFFVAEAATGRMVPSAGLSFLGYGMHYGRNGGRPTIVPDEFAARTDEYGMALVPNDRMDDKMWLVTAETDDGRFAYLGFESICASCGPDDGRGQTESCFVITDRPAYRPGQDIDFKVWYGLASYDGRAAEVDGKRIKVTVRNPRGETIYEKPLTTDAFGGAADTLSFGPHAMLGTYYIETDRGGGIGFRLEEYKKPEYEVSVETPDKAIILGDTAQVKIRARYYYGAPVTNARVSYRIVRTTHRNTWTPPWRWDWLYGAGAWQREDDYSWYPGSASWAPPDIRPPWIFEQPEVVAEGEGEVDPDGVFRIDLDTAPAKQLFGDRDHAYEITVEVTDASRRTIVGNGKVVASRRPFAVTVWTDRGFYPAGDRIAASVRAALPLGGGVEATGRAILSRIRYDENGAPSETEVATRPLATDANGTATAHFTPTEAGQYRLSCVLEDANGNVVEGARIVTVRGQPGEGDFRYGPLELVPDKRDYAPGDMVKLAINSRFKNATVLLFPRVERSERDGALLPLIYHLEDGSDVVEIPVGMADQPNFFCEAITIHDGRIYSETREIFVPPADKTLNVEITPDKTTYAPGENATFTLRISGDDGRPVVGQCVVSVYDRSVEYISGGANVADIRSFFWSWKRHYSSLFSSSLDKLPYTISHRDDEYWVPIGAFGNQEADWNAETVYGNGALPRRQRMTVNADMMALEAMPAPAAPMQAKMEMAMDAAPAASANFAGGALSTGGGEAVEPTLRSEFADTALWLAAVETDADGVASFSLAMPENLTAWKARTWVMGHGVRVGESEETVETKKDVIVRPQAPRFLTQTDQVILSANLHNYLPRAKAARAELILEGGLLEADASSPLVRQVQLAANGEARVDWLVHARRPGDARVVMRLLTDEESDAAEIVVPVVVHGARRVESYGGVIRGDRTREVIRFTVPEERLAERSRFEFSFSPSVAGAMLEALPFLIDYPYGCTEQTLNRFLPVVMTRRFLDRLGVNLADARAVATAKRDDPQSAAWRGTWGDDRAKASAVFDDDELSLMTSRGVERLAAMQNAEGGWGWFSGAGERSWPHTTAVVVYGLQTAVANGVPLPRGLLDNGIDWLRGHQQQQIERLKADPESDGAKANADNTDAFIYMVLALDGRRPLDPDMRDFLYRDRLGLSPTALAMLGIALHQEGATNALDMVVRNLSQFVKTDEAAGTAWLQTPAQGWWWWYNDAIESQAWYLKLLARVEPRGELASGVAKYLLQNRKNGNYWRSTRDTAYAIDALAEYAVASGEADPTMEVVMTLDGVEVMRRILTAKELLQDNRLVLEGLAVEPGDHELRLERTGTGTLYYSGALDVFSLEDPIRAAGSDLAVMRRFYKLEPGERSAEMPTASGTSVRGAVEGYRRVELPGLDGGQTATVQSGDLVKVELTIDAKNDYEYLVFEDMKAAGLEAVEVQSGYTANRLGAYVEYRDQKVVLFLRYLPRGTHTISYRFRAETPGAFSALPVFGGGMYATELFTNSDEMKIRIGEAGTFE